MFVIIEFDCVLTRSFPVSSQNFFCSLPRDQSQYVTSRRRRWIIFHFPIVQIHFVFLLKTYDTIDRHGMWEMQRVYGAGGKFMKAVQSFYVDSRACVRVGNDVSGFRLMLDCGKAV